MYMLSNVLRNIMGKYSTRLYPFETRPAYEGFRGKLVNNIHDCIFCKSCQIKCPSQCITVDPKEGKWDCDPFACVYCSVCVDACPTHCLSMENQHRKPAPSKFVVSLQGTPRKSKKADKTGDKPAEAAAPEA